MSKINKNAKDILIIGLAFFATYFGAGNLIFPPMLGLQSGSNWVTSVFGLGLSGVLLPILGIIIISLAGGTVSHLTSHISKNFYSILVGVIMVFATFISVPRTAAVAAELGVQGIFPNTPYIPIVVIYFAMVFYFAYNEGSVLDKIGKILTPALTIILVIIVIKGFITPVGTPLETPLKAPFVNSFIGGYQTGDLLVSFMMANVFIGTIVNKGYATDKERNGVTIKAGIIAFICLFVVYGGLLYLGACGSSIFPEDIDRSNLLVSLVQTLGGRVAMSGLGIAVVLACLTTAIGQVAAIADYFVELSKNRLNYKITALVISSIGTLIALMGVDKIVHFSGPIFLAVYPSCIAVVVLGVFRKVIPNDGSYKGAIALTVVYSLLEALLATGANVGFVSSFVNAMPFSAQGFGWVLPFVVGLAAGTIVYKLKADNKTENVAS